MRWSWGLLVLLAAAGCAGPQPRVAYTPAGTTGEAVVLIERRVSAPDRVRDYIVVCHAGRAPLCARVRPATVAETSEQRQWVASEAEARPTQAPYRVSAPATAVAPAARAPQPAPTPPEAVAESAGVDVPALPSTEGELTFDAVPWCNVSVDGRPVGQTPVVRLALAAGTHLVTCSSPSSGTRTVSLTIEAGQTTRHRLSF